MFYILQIFVCIRAVSSAVSQDEQLYPTNVGPEISFLNVDKVWRKNKISGKNILVAVVDDGVNYNHMDLKENYAKEASYDFVDNDPYPFPSWGWPFSSHGTQCAGIIAAKLNGACRTGVAYNAKLAGIRIFSKSFVYKDNSTLGLAHNKDKIDIYSNSWGPTDNGYNIKGPETEGRNALKEGALKGRNGLGSIFVFPSGNGGVVGDSCAFDGYVNSIYTVAIGAVSGTGTVPHYAEPCSSVIASAYGDEVRTCDLLGCNSKFGKSSAATAFASGIVALLLEANDKLTWRDVQHLIIRTSNPQKIEIAHNEWTVNGAGLIVHPMVGFGVMNAAKLVDLAQKWKNVPKQLNCSVEWPKQSKIVYHSGAILRRPFLRYGECSRIKSLEHVKVEMTLSFQPRAHMIMELTSPQGTKSQLLYYRVFDAITRRKVYKELSVISLHFWGENPEDGLGWRVTVNSAKFKRRSIVSFDKLKITFYGTKKDPISRKKMPEELKGTILCSRSNKKFWRGYGSKCCDMSWIYDPKREECCNGTHKVVEKYPRCGGEIYDKCKKLCCGGKLHDITKAGKEMFCCGKTPYSKETGVCCGQSVHKRYVCKCPREKLQWEWEWKRQGSRWTRKAVCASYNKRLHEIQCVYGQRTTEVLKYDKYC